MKEKAVVVFSGGQDSTTCLYWAIDRGYEVHALTIDYGQKHQKEVDAAMVIAAMAKVQHTVISIPYVLQGTSPLVSDSTLEEYESVEALPSGLEKTFVPMRNQLLITIAANHAYCLGAGILIYGNCLEDFEGYPDCRPDFIRSIESACNIGTFVDKPLTILTPLMHLTKAQTVLLAKELPGCMRALAYSHTSYSGSYPPVTKDHASLLRARGFEEAGVPDPLVLRAVKDGLMPLPDTDNYKGL